MEKPKANRAACGIVIEPPEQVHEPADKENSK